MFEDEDLVVERLNELLDELPDEDIVNMYNNMVNAYMSDDYIYSMDDLDEVVQRYQYGATELIDSIDSAFDTSDYYFTIDDNRYIYSFTDLLATNSPYYKDALIDAIVANAVSYDNPEVEAIIEEFWV